MSYIQLPLVGASLYWGNAVSAEASLPAVGDATGQVIQTLDTNALYSWDGAAWVKIVDGLADVAGPASSTDNALALFDGITGKVIKAASAITASRALASNASGVPVAATTTTTELNFVSGVTSAIQTQINTKAAGAASSTDEALARFDSTTGKVLQNSAVTLTDAGGMTFTGTTGYLRLPNLTTTQRDALTAADGMMIFNTSTSRFQGYFGGSWADLHGWGS